MEYKDWCLMVNLRSGGYGNRKHLYMNLYCTEINAICPHTGEMKKWAGPTVRGISFEDAQNYCELNGLGYCRVVGVLMAEVSCKEGSVEPDWSKEIDYSKLRLN